MVAPGYGYGIVVTAAVGYGGPQSRFYVANVYPPTSVFSKGHISTPRGYCGPKFLHALENDQVLLGHP